MPRFPHLISPSPRARGANAPSIKTTRRSVGAASSFRRLPPSFCFSFPHLSGTHQSVCAVVHCYRSRFSPLNVRSCLLASYLHWKVRASITMPSIAALLVLAIGALVGRVDAQGNRPWQLAVRPRYIHEQRQLNRAQTQSFPFRASSMIHARMIRHSSPSAFSPAAARRAPFAATPWHSMRVP